MKKQKPNSPSAQHYQNQQMDNVRPHCSYRNQPPNRVARSNIVQTMEPFQPTSAHSLPTSHQHHNAPYNHHHHQDYSYAYYELGQPLSHSNVPYPGHLFEPGPSGKILPSNSLRALLSVANNRTRQTHQVQGQENVYEEIAAANSARSSMTSLASSRDIVEHEFNQVAHRHRKTLGELNLAVEAMLMPSSTITEENEEDEKNSNNISMVSNELDSGFSGSSGCGSYIGHLRFQKSETRSSAQQKVRCDNNSDNISVASDSAYCRRGLTNLLSGSTKSLKKMLDSSPNSPKMNAKNSPKVRFWKKLPGFLSSSGTKINKMGINLFGKLKK